MTESNVYKITLRLKLDRERDYEIYQKIKDKENINEYIKYCIENVSEKNRAGNIPEPDDISSGMTVNLIREIVKNAVREELTDIMQHELRSDMLIADPDAEREDLVIDETEEDKHDNMNSELPEEALNFLNSL